MSVITRNPPPPKSITIQGDHPYYHLLKAYQEILNSDTGTLLPFIGSYCMYENPRYNEPMFKCELQVILAERMMLFGFDPTPVLTYDFNFTKDLLYSSEETRIAAKTKYVNLLMSIYIRIIYPEATDQK